MIEHKQKAKSPTFGYEYPSRAKGVQGQLDGHFWGVSVRHGLRKFRTKANDKTGSCPEARYLR